MEMSPTCAAATKAVENGTVLPNNGIRKLHYRCRAGPGRGASQAFICECSCHGAAAGNESTH